MDDPTLDQFEAANAASRMASFAKLTADWEVGHKSYLDNFISFVLGAVASQRLDTFTPESIAKALVETYGLSIPVAVVHQVLRRAARQNLVTSVGHSTYRPLAGALDTGAQHVAEIARFEREQNHLAKELALWSATMLKRGLNEQQSIEALLNYIETYFGPIMSSASGRGTISSATPESRDPVHRMVASFIADASKSHPERFDYLVNFAKGSMLAAAVFSPADASPMDSPFRETWLILDTRVLLRTLGYEGDIETAATLDYIKTAQLQGAKVGYFDFTMTEVLGVFDGADAALTHRNAWSWDPGSLGAYFLENGLSSTDLRLHRGSLEDRLTALSISQLPRPAWRNHNFVVDESELESALQGLGEYRNVAALRHDVSALAAIVRFRQGRGGRSLEDCRGVFITTNQRLLTAARRVEDTRSEPWPVAIRETDLATLIWVKTPLRAPDLPRRALVATCLTVLRPSIEMWSKYVNELERRHAAGDLTDAELMYVRRQYEQDNVELYIKTADTDFNFATSIDLMLSEAHDALAREVAAPFAAASEQSAKNAQEALGKLAELESRVSQRDREADDLSAELTRTSTELTQTRRLIIEAAQRRSKALAGIATWGSVVTLTALLGAASFLAPLPTPWDVIAAGAALVVTVAGGALAPGRAIGRAIGGRALASRLRKFGINLSESSSRLDSSPASDASATRQPA